ncbi:MAG TPA: tyrosine-type recombinase/integrase [Pirellulaceae bacterium]
MTNSSNHSAARKPAKLDPNWRIQWGLHPQFPLFPHWSQRWAKKVRGKLHYFGSVAGDPKGTKALDLWNEQKDDLIAGRLPRAKSDALTLAELCNRFLGSKRADLDAGKLTARSFVEYHRTTDLLIAHFGKNRVVIDLRADDFESLYIKLARKHSVVSLGREITHAKSVFRYAMESDLVEKVIKVGPKFRAPSKSDRRKARANQQHKYGKRLFTAEEMQKLIAAAGLQLRAMLLLGCNAALGNTDCALLPMSAIDLETGWLDYPRPKTGVQRRVPLWHETIEALKAVIAKRKPPKNPDTARLVFVTKRGQPWVRYELTETPNEAGTLDIAGVADDAIAKAIRKLLGELGIYRRGLSFYSIRHTFETVAGGCRDQVAVNAVMGHVDASMAAEYREHIEDERLIAAVNHVREWLFAKNETSKRAAEPKKRIAGDSRRVKANASLANPLLRVVG